ncbi:unnamed protein product [Discula destructiva]
MPRPTFQPGSQHSCFHNSSGKPESLTKYLGYERHRRLTADSVHPNVETYEAAARPEMKQPLVNIEKDGDGYTGSRALVDANRRDRAGLPAEEPGGASGPLEDGVISQGPKLTCICSDEVVQATRSVTLFCNHSYCPECLHSYFKLALQGETRFRLDSAKSSPPLTRAATF